MGHLLQRVGPKEGGGGENVVNAGVKAAGLDWTRAAGQLPAVLEAPLFPHLPRKLCLRALPGVQAPDLCNLVPALRDVVLPGQCIKVPRPHLLAARVKQVPELLVDLLLLVQAVGLKAVVLIRGREESIMETCLLLW